MTSDLVPMRGLKTIGLGLVLLATTSLAVSAKPAHKTKHWASRSYHAHRYSADDHYGQRSYSISVGNPAFPDRFAHWPNRWND